MVAAAPSSTIGLGARQCCDKIVASPVPAQKVECGVTAGSPPMLVAVAGQSTRVRPVGNDLRRVPFLDPPPVLSLVLANCARLI